MTRTYPWIYGAIGIHPEHAGEMNEENLAWLKQASAEDKVVAIGEIGLDYYWDEPAREIQKACFLQQLELARETGLPVVIHSRDAAKDTLDIMRETYKELAGGVIHCFSYSVEVAREFLDMGFYLGVGGVVTFKNAVKLKEVVEFMPLDRLVLETDCPYLAPAPNRGKRNSSLNLPYVIEEISRIRGMDTETVTAVTRENARALYRL